MAKRIGVVGITKAENAQLGLLLKYILANDEVYNSIPKKQWLILMLSLHYVGDTQQDNVFN